MDKEPTWHGIPRRDIPWYPTVDGQTCIGCALCYTTCGRGVYEMEENKASVVKPLSCMVGCSTCGTVCPVEAISFPARDLIWKLEREHKIFKIVRQEAKEKKAKQDVAAARARAEDIVAKLVVRTRFEISGEFGEKRFLVQMEDLLGDGPYDFVNVRLEVPTVRGAREKTPSLLTFEVTSTGQEDIQDFLPSVRELVRTNGLVLVNETKL
jgi:NAD-dependent dihydropyrimidine dehydrogenase PreA subunit